MNHQQHYINNHPLSPPSTSTNTPNSLSNNNQDDSVQLDYPPKSPDEMPSSTRLLLSSTSTTSTTTTTTTTSSLSSEQLNYNKHKHALQLTSIPLHLPKPKQQLPISSNRIPSNQQHNSDLLASFSEECRKMFYTGDPIATKNVESIIKNLPAASKAAYTKQMATVRSQFHRDAASSRRAEVDKLLHDTLPSSIIIKAVGNDSSLWALRSPRARQERLDRLKKFINAHCVRNMVGVHPFFNSLCAVLHLLSLPARKSGAGKRRVEWEIDLALFCEAGGEPFLVDSIQLLKGVLGFEDHLKPLVASSLRNSFGTHNTSNKSYSVVEDSEDEDGAEGLVIGHVDGDDGMTLEERQELELDEAYDPSSVGEGPFADDTRAGGEDEGYGQARGLKGKTTLRARDRALSDPFLDPAPPARSSAARDLATSSPRITVSPPATEEEHEHHQIGKPSPLGLGYPQPLSNTHHHHFHHPSKPKSKTKRSASFDQELPSHRRSPTQNSLDAPPPSEIRLFRSPSYLTNPELLELISVFPNFIKVRIKSIKFDRLGILDSSSSSSVKDRHEKHSQSSSSAASSKRKGSSGQLYPNGRSAGASAAPNAGFFGHGSIQLSVFEKDLGWKGSFIERIKMFFFRFFKF
ncbi:hypothetical protein PGT21_021582 [Puccinia graminis f. sp. tritici]|uniref:Uncharacterized protein n=1 Tax=Puccinia graminis f. sp. tritici TaxID=56615 RepID=A0A5B0NLN5_PUCGR|nr:hypothetical protein PGT21_021582 [Puccinia graminis f. sp. tritici]